LGSHDVIGHVTIW